LLNVQRDPATGIEQDERATELAGIETDITEYLNETFPLASVRITDVATACKERCI
jgi:hypothetical protein